MSSDDQRPLLLLDVDGPLNPYAASNSQLRYPDWQKARNASNYAGCRVRLNRKHGARLRNFAREAGVELAWATMWGPWAANVYIGHFIGLPHLDGVDFSSLDMAYVEEHGKSWKFGYVEHWAGARPLAWLDDEFQVEHVFRDQFLARREALGAPTLLVDVSPSAGFTEDHLDVVKTWAAGDSFATEWAVAAGPSPARVTAP